MKTKFAFGILVIFFAVIAAMAHKSSAIPANVYPKANVVLIVVDCLRKDHLGSYGYPLPATPVLDAFARSSFVYDRAYSQAGWTVPSIASILTSLYPHQHQTIQPDTKLPEGLLTIAETLRASGYATGAVVSHMFLSPSYELNRGFDTYDTSVFSLKRNPHLIASAHDVTARAVDFIASTKTPFFLWLHYFDPHADYLDLPPSYFGKEPINFYDREIANTDAAIGGFLRQLTARGLLDTTIVMIMADHGEEFRDHRAVSHESYFEEVLAIPLLLRLPGGSSRLISAGYVEQIDVAPTLLRLVGTEPPSQFAGVSFFPDDPNKSVAYMQRPAFGNRIQRAAIYDGQMKLVVIDEKIGRRWDLFDLAVDPFEQKNLARLQPEDVKRLEQRLEQHLKEQHLIGRATIELEPEDEDVLRAMGYVE